MYSLMRKCSLSTVLLVGCASATSTLVESESGRSCATDVRGKGYPMTVKVATHLKVTVYETMYFETVPESVPAEAAGGAETGRNVSATTQKESKPPKPDPGGTGEKPAEESSPDAISPPPVTASGQVLSTPGHESPEHAKVEAEEVCLKQASLGRQPTAREVTDSNHVPIRTYDFATQVMETDSIVLVDQKRPAAGNLAYRTSISPDYSLNRIQAKVEDVTIRQIGFGVASVIASVTGATQPQDPGELKLPETIGEFQDLKQTSHARPEPVSAGLPAAPANLFTVHREIASRIFDLNDSDLELQIAEFLSLAIPRPIRCPANNP